MWLVVKSEHLEAAKELFEGTGINVTESGKRYLGAVVGARAAEDFVRDKVADWVKDVENLAVCDCRVSATSSLCCFHSQPAW